MPSFSLGSKKVSVHGCFPPHAIRLAKALLESGLYSEEPITVKGVETTPLELMHDILLQLPETKQTPLWAYGLVLESGEFLPYHILWNLLDCPQNVGS